MRSSSRVTASTSSVRGSKARPSVVASNAEASSGGKKPAERVKSTVQASPPRPVQFVVSTGAEVLSLNEERRELICSLIGLSVKIGLVIMSGVSLCRLAGAYQERMDRQGELSAVLEIEKAQLAKAQDRFDQLFMVDGEQKLIREQSQWIAPNRLRIVWQSSDPMPERPVLAMQPPSASAERP